MATLTDISMHLCVDKRIVSELVDRGIIERQPRGQYDLDVVRESYIRNLREVAAGRAGKNGELDLTAERARLAKEQADAKEMENLKARGSLVTLDQVDKFVSKAFIDVRNWALNSINMLPATTSRADRSAYETEVRKLQDDLIKRVQDLAGSLAELREADPAESDPDEDSGEAKSKPVGRKRPSPQRGGKRSNGKMAKQ